MIQIVQRLIAFCAFLLVALWIGNPPPGQAQTYLCKQADGSEIVTNSPTGGACKPFTPKKGAAHQAPNREKMRAQESAEAQRQETEAQNRRVQELLEAQRQATVDMRRRAAEEDAQRQAAAAQLQAQEAQRLAAEAQRQAGAQTIPIPGQKSASVYLPMVIVGFAIALVGDIWIVILAFRKWFLWGIACLFIPGAGFIYGIMCWDEAKVPFIINLIGTALFFLSGGCHLPVFSGICE